MTLHTVDPIDPAELRALLELVERPLTNTGKKVHNILRIGQLARGTRPRWRVQSNHPVHARPISRAHLSTGSAVTILQQYLEIARHAPEVHALWFDPSELGFGPATTHSSGEAPASWRWAAEVSGCLWDTGEAIYGRQVPPLELILVRAVLAREIRDHATVLLRNQGTRFAPWLGSGEAIVTKARDDARRLLSRLTRPDTRVGDRYARELVVFTDNLELHRVRPMRA